MESISPGEGDIRSCLKIIRENAGFVEDMADYVEIAVKTRYGEITPRFCEFDLNVLLYEISEAIDKRNESSGGKTVKWEFSENCRRGPLYIKTDIDCLRKVLMILVDMVFRYSTEGVVKIGCDRGSSGLSTYIKWPDANDIYELNGRPGMSAKELMSKKNLMSGRARLEMIVCCRLLNLTGGSFSILRHRDGESMYKILFR
jgi:hypothetical protein